MSLKSALASNHNLELFKRFDHKEISNNHSDNYDLLAKKQIDNLKNEL